MSKYYKADDISQRLLKLCDKVDYMDAGQRVVALLNIHKCIDAIYDLPTIEVSEEELRKKYKDFYEQGKYDALIEVSEDCISRAELLKDFGCSELTRKWGGDHSGYDTYMVYEIQNIIEDAPSVVPSRAEGEWLTKTVKKFCASDCWYPGVFAIEDSWDEEEGSWLEEQDGFCSKCGEQDEHYHSHNFCPNCGSRMRGGHNDE